MRFYDIKNEVLRIVRGVSNVVTHPVETVKRLGRRRVLQALDSTEIGKRKEATNRRSSGTGELNDLTAAQQRQQRSRNFQLQPTAPPKPNLIGNYTLGKQLGSDNWVDLYEGTAAGSRDAVWIYHYQWDKCGFHDEKEIRDRTAAFKQRVQKNTNLGYGSDFRVVGPKAVIAAEDDSSIYLVSKAIPDSMSLEQFLTENAGYPFSVHQVREFIRQIVQSLRYLYAYRVRLGDRTLTEKLSHGNLTPRSIWIRLSKAPTATRDTSFFVYLTRLQLWEYLFSPGQDIDLDIQRLGSIRGDLRALGEIAHGLLIGQVNLSISDYKDSAVWPAGFVDSTLYELILKMLGVDGNLFKELEDVATELNRSPVLEGLPAYEQPQTAVERERANLFTVDAKPMELTLGVWLWLFTGISLCGFGAWLLYSNGTQLGFQQDFACVETENCTLNAPKAEKSLIYSFEADEAWRTVINSVVLAPNELSRLNLDPQSKPRPIALIQGLSNWKTLVQGGSHTSGNSSEPPQGDDDDKNRVVPVRLVDGNRQDVIANKNKADSTNLPKTVAYDGIAMFVVYADARQSKQSKNAARLIKRGISLDEIRGWFYNKESVEKVKPSDGAEDNSAEELSPTIRLNGEEIDVKLYFPFYDDDDSLLEDDKAEVTIELFRKILFEDGSEGEAAFKKIATDVKKRKEVEEQREKTIYSRMRRDFDAPSASGTIGIGFDRISQMSDQCSVYPLTLRNGISRYRLFIGRDGRPIRDDVDLCKDKGAYWVDSEIFPNYPMSIPMAVGCLEKSSSTDGETDESERCESSDGQAFAEGLLTLEGQYVLSQTGLVPITPIGEIRRYVWSQENQEKSNVN
ncbi:MAG: hypothetical protein AAFV85_23455 [Cyanobacteria bacterium J06634_6]